MKLRDSNVTRLFMDVFYPQRCISCGKFGQILCLECADAIDLIKTSLCPGCGKITEISKYCSRCKNGQNIFTKGIIVAAHYDSGPLKELIYHFKYLGFISIAPILAELICQQIEKKIGVKNAIVVPVPLHLRRLNRRGYNQAELIARELSKRLDLPGGTALGRFRDTPSQVGLNRVKRLENLRKAFECVDAELIDGKSVLLIDDVTTTGATLNECARALREAGAKEVWGVVVARNI